MSKNNNDYNNEPNASNISYEEKERRDMIEGELLEDFAFNTWQLDCIYEEKKAIDYLKRAFPKKTNYWELNDFELAYMRYEVIPEVQYEY
jgi:hypothetical protein